MLIIYSLLREHLKILTKIGYNKDFSIEFLTQTKVSKLEWVMSWLSIRCIGKKIRLISCPAPWPTD